MEKDAKKNRFRALAYLAQGILPFEQWSSVFSNPELHDRPGLVCKSFVVWFPTMVDYLMPSQEVSQSISELSKDSECEEVISLCCKLEEHYRNFLSNFSREEQIFINDRRLQNVHGVLSMFRLDKIHVKHYCKEDDEVVVEHIDSDKYHEMMKIFYPSMQEKEMELRNRLVTSNIFKQFGIFYLDNLKIDPHIINLATKLGVYDNQSA